MDVDALVVYLDDFVDEVDSQSGLRWLVKCVGRETGNQRGFANGRITDDDVLELIFGSFDFKLLWQHC